MGGKCKTNEGTINLFKKPSSEKPAGKSRHRWEKNIQMNLVIISVKV